MMHLKWLPIGLVVTVATLVAMDSVTAEEGEQRAAAISNLSFRQVQVSLAMFCFRRVIFIYDFSISTALS